MLLCIVRRKQGHPSPRTQSLIIPESMRALMFCLTACSLFVFIGCQSQRTDAPSGQNTPTPVPPAIAPGHVSLTGELDDCTESARSIHCNLTVSSVQEYGAGTTQFPSGTQILVSVRPEILDAFEQSIESTISGRPVSLVIVAERPAPDDTSQPAWRVSSLKTA